MSKTDKTAPFHVKLRRGDLTTVEYHDHRNGVCDLEKDPDRVRFAVGACYRDFHYTGVQTCCCRMCHAVEPPLTETQRRRRDRHTGKRDFLHWRDEYEMDAVNETGADECPYDHRPCSLDSTLCCAPGRADLAAIERYRRARELEAR